MDMHCDILSLFVEKCVGVIRQLLSISAIVQLRRGVSMFHGGFGWSCRYRLCIRRWLLPELRCILWVIEPCCPLSWCSILPYLQVWRCCATPCVWTGILLIHIRCCRYNLQESMHSRSLLRLQRACLWVFGLWCMILCWGLYACLSLTLRTLLNSARIVSETGWTAVIKVFLSSYTYIFNERWTGVVTEQAWKLWTGQALPGAWACRTGGRHQCRILTNATVMCILNWISGEPR